MLPMYISTISVTNSPFVSYAILTSIVVFYYQLPVKLSDNLFGVQHGFPALFTLKPWRIEIKNRVETKFMDFICM